MKRFITIILILSAGLSAFAQKSFSLTPKVVNAAGPASNTSVEGLSTIQNNTTDPYDSVFKWVILSIDMPTTWEYGMCDPFNCMFSLKAGDSSRFELGKGKNGSFKLDFSPNGKGGKATVAIAISSVKNPQQVDTLYGYTQAWASAVKEVNNTDFQLFPNPAKDKLVFKYSGKDNLEVEIFNIIGNRVKSFTHRGMQSEIDLTDMQNGMYILRFKDGAKTLSKSFSKVD